MCAGECFRRLDGWMDGHLDLNRSSSGSRSERHGLVLCDADVGVVSLPPGLETEDAPHTGVQGKVVFGI